MTLDGFFTRALVDELRSQLIEGRVHKIYQPFEQELQIVIRANRTNHRLAASVHPNYFSLYLTQEKSANPQQAPMFCMLLRKYLESAFIIDIKQYQNDRIIDFYFTGRDEIGVDQEYLLTFELMGRHSNILLVDQNKQTIIDCIKHVPDSQNSFRSLTPGAEFKRPPRNLQQVNLFELNDSQLFEFSHQNEAILREGKAYQCVQGMGKLLAQEIAFWMSNEGGNLSSLASLERVKSAIEFPSPTLYQTEKNVYFYAFKLENLPGKEVAFDSLSDLIYAYSHQKVHLDRVKQLSGNIINKINQIIDKNQKKLKNLAKDRRVAAGADNYRIKGELLNAYAYQIEAKENQVTLANFYDDNKPMDIQLNPRLNAVENAQIYFKKYQKYRDALKYINREESLTLTEIDYLDGILVQLKQADLEDVESIKQELIEQGYVGQKRSSSKKRAKTQSKPRRFKSSDGVMIYVGRNNQQNDELSMKKASKNHWWLHAKDIPGAHVIVESDKPSQETLLQAAQLAAYYSKFSQSANVPVDYVQVKHLKKPNGAKPGFVIYEGQKTLFVTPDASLIEQLSLKK
ncbi:NFACT family protein [Facklamia sp. 7083-14-GEN3]|uniref:Rqc2 family fibronectin-binding protein n=1 Tax=Facklamia sp. 7083-14-GEN3 TaxID=2973478 RepID=UPI00215CA54A|nr:NFACT family protein [Facklamia sp. 7083-14-GEN3]MCR8968848.1 NFACT family protein [Facklamia sp. 7083-14-GEN3]